MLRVDKQNRPMLPNTAATHEQVLGALVRAAHAHGLSPAPNVGSLVPSVR
jgi:hypothetical protein